MGFNGTNGTDGGGGGGSNGNGTRRRRDVGESETEMEVREDHLERGRKDIVGFWAGGRKGKRDGTGSGSDSGDSSSSGSASGSASGNGNEDEGGGEAGFAAGLDGWLGGICGGNQCADQVSVLDMFYSGHGVYNAGSVLTFPAEVVGDVLSPCRLPLSRLLLPFLFLPSFSRFSLSVLFLSFFISLAFLYDPFLRPPRPSQSFSIHWLSSTHPLHITSKFFDSLTLIPALIGYFRRSSST